MSESILDPLYWKQRLETAKELHQAIFKCPLDRWQKIEQRHREILATVTCKYESILDAGCGWGRLLSLLPSDWMGYYLGVDLSPDFIDLAQNNYPRRKFLRADLSSLPEITDDLGFPFDWAILISIRPMVKRNLGREAWDQMEKELRKVALRLLYLEYDPEDWGEIA